MTPANRFTGGVLAIDAATTTGFCFGHPGGTLQFGSIRFGRPGESRPVTYRAMRTWLQGWLMPPVKRIVYESAAIEMIMSGRSSGDATKKLIGMVEHIEEMCYGRVELREAKASDVRKFFIGQNVKRGLAKAMTKERCREMGFDVRDDDNAADAIALWHFQIAYLRPDLAVKMTPMFSEG